MKITPAVTTFALLCLLPALPCFSANDNTHGRMAFSGELLEAACSIDPANRTIAIDFGDVSARVIRSPAEGGVSRPLYIRLTGCPLIKRSNGRVLYPYATITLNGEVTAQDATAISAYGSAEGIGIHIRDKDGKIITPGRPSTGYELNNEENVLTFYASLVPVKENIKTGEFDALMRFSIDYN